MLSAHKISTKLVRETF